MSKLQPESMVKNSNFVTPKHGQILTKANKSMTQNGERLKSNIGQIYISLEAAALPMDIILIQRKGMKLSVDAAKPIWLACQLEQMLPLEEFWPLYQRRFNIDHWNRFAKQRLHWTLPKLSTPSQGQSWSDLMPLLTWQLWLAREIVQDNPLPWQKPQPFGQLTPGRVAQSFGAILAVIGTPACEPKPRGKSNGWPKGKKRTPKIHYPVVKKRYSPPPKSKKTAS